MCSGKTTLVNKLAKNNNENLVIAEEPTPPPLSPDVTLQERQQKIFDTYTSYFDKLINSETKYLCDYSPWGIIPFELGLSEYNFSQGKLEEAFILSDMAKTHHNALILKQKQWNDKCIMLRFLSAKTGIIMRRLAIRNRAGDNLWQRHLVALLNKYYDSYFKYLLENKLLGSVLNDD